jgi:GGDEF domain-containing protein
MFYRPVQPALLDETLGRNWRVRRKQLPVSLVMLDIDHFKSFNEYGWWATVCCKIGRIAAEQVRGRIFPAAMAARNL